MLIYGWWWWWGACYEQILKLCQSADEILRAITPSQIPVATGDLCLHQLALLQILKRFTIFLDEKGIEYWLYAGTFIGAIRHKGFVPWDDDIAMTRENCKKLMEVIDEFCQNGFYYSDEEMVRILYKNTTPQLDIFLLNVAIVLNCHKMMNIEKLVGKMWEFYHSIPYNSFMHLHNKYGDFMNLPSTLYHHGQGRCLTKE